MMVVMKHLIHFFLTSIYVELYLHRLVFSNLDEESDQVYTKAQKKRFM